MKFAYPALASTTSQNAAVQVTPSIINQALQKSQGSGQIQCRKFYQKPESLSSQQKTLRSGKTVCVIL